MSHLIYRIDNGEILRRMAGNAEQIEGCLQEGEALIEGTGDWTTHRVVDGAVVSLAEPRTPPGAGWAWDFDAACWVQARSLAEQREAAWARIKDERAQRITAPITAAGFTFDADEQSQARILAAIQLADIVGPTWSTVWTLADNSSVTVTRADLVAVVAAVGARTNTAFMQARTLRDQIEVASAEELGAITWPKEPTS